MAKTHLLRFDKSGVDSVGSANATFNNGTWVNGICNFCIYFAGANKTTYDTKLLPTGAKTISLLYRTTSTSTGYIYDTTGGGASRGFMINTKNSLVYIAILKSSVVDYDIASYNVKSGWNHLLFTWDGTTNTNSAKFYLNGNLESQKTPSVTDQGEQNNSQFGVYFGGTSYYYTGSLDEFMTDNSNYTPAKAKNEYLKYTGFFS